MDGFLNAGGGSEGVPARDLRAHLAVAGPAQERAEAGQLSYYSLIVYYLYTL